MEGKCNTLGNVLRTQYFWDVRFLIILIILIVPIILLFFIATQVKYMLNL